MGRGITNFQDFEMGITKFTLDGVTKFHGYTRHNLALITFRSLTLNTPGDTSCDRLGHRKSLTHPSFPIADWLRTTLIQVGGSGV